MKKEVIARGQMQVLIFIFPLGLYLLFGMGSEAKQDAWIASVFAVIISIPIVYIFGKLASLYPGKNIYDILEIVFGKIFGKLLIVVMIVHCMFVTGNIMYNMGDFIKLNSLWYTPKTIVLLCIIILLIWILRKGIEVLFNWSRINIILVAVALGALTFLLIPKLDISNIRPVYTYGMKNLFMLGINVAMISFTQAFIYLGFFDSVEKKKLSTIFIKPTIFSGILCTLIVIANVLIIGGTSYDAFYYPAYEAMRRVYSTGEYQRLESMVSVCFMVIRFMELCVCLLATSKGIQKLFNLSGHKTILAPTGFIVLNIAYVLYGSAMEASEFLKEVWGVYGIIFQVILPVFIFICAYVKVKSKEKYRSGTT